MLANMQTIAKKTSIYKQNLGFKEISILSFFIFVYFVNILPLNQAGEIARYVGLYMLFTFIIIFLKNIHDTYLKESESEINTEQEKNEFETVKIPEFSWATEHADLKNNQKEDAIQTENLKINIFLNIQTTILFILFSPVIFKILDFQTFKTFLLNIFILPILLFSFWGYEFIFKKMESGSQNILLVNTFIVFTTTNILSLIFKIPFMGIFISIFMALLYFNYYIYIIEKNIKILKNINFTIDTFTKEMLENILKTKDIFIVNWKDILKNNLNKLFFIFFLNIDIFISAINFSNTLNGIYFTFSIFIKYLLLAFVILNIEKIKNIFNEKSIAVINSNINILIFISFVSTIFSFFISYVLVGLFFNDTYFIYHTSLAFVFMAIAILGLSYYMLYTAININKKNTLNIFAIWFVFFLFLISIFKINSLETLSFFIIGSFSILAIFIYHFVIKIKDGYFSSLFA